MGELVIVVIHLAVIAKVLLLLLLLTQTRILFRTIWDRETIRTVFHFCVSSWPDEVGSFLFFFFFENDLFSLHLLFIYLFCDHFTLYLFMLTFALHAHAFFKPCIFTCSDLFFFFFTL